MQNDGYLVRYVIPLPKLRLQTHLTLLRLPEQVPHVVTEVSGALC